MRLPSNATPDPEGIPARPGPRSDVMVLADFTPRGGRSMDLFFAGLARALVDGERRVELVFAGAPPEAFSAPLAAIGVGIGTVEFPFGTRSAARIFTKLRRLHRPVLQAHFLGSFERRLFALRAAGGAHRLEIVDHLSGSLRPLGPAAERLRSLRGALASAVVDRYVAVSEFVANRLRRAGVRPARIRIVENGIALERFAGERTSAPPPCIVYAGQLISEKGVSVLLRAAARLPSGVHLRIAGVGPEAAALEAEARALGLDARFLGQVDTAALFRSADVVVVPSLWDEAFGLVAAEAMAAGAAVIVADAGGLPEVVGDAGLVVARGDAGALAQALTALLGDAGRRETLGARARTRARERFALDRMIRAHAAGLEALAAGASPRMRAI